MGKIMAVNISEERGTQKKNVHSARLIEDWGIEHDVMPENGIDRSACSLMRK